MSIFKKITELFSTTPSTQERALAGDAQAAFELAQKQQFIDDEAYIKWLTIAAEGGLAEAQNSLAKVYHPDLGELYKELVEQDYRISADWTIKAAEQDNADAQMRLSLACSSGEGVSKDEQKAFYWTKRAAENGDYLAMMELGAAYKDGTNGLAQDKERAVEWLSKAAEGAALYGDNILSQHAREEVIIINGSPEEVQAITKKREKDSQEHFEKLLREATDGNVISQFWVAKYYVVIQDIEKAKFWFSKAAAQGNEQAKDELEQLNKEK